MKKSIYSANLNQTCFQQFVSESREVSCQELLEAVRWQGLSAFCDMVELLKAEDDERYIALVEQLVEETVTHEVEIPADHAELLPACPRIREDMIDEIITVYHQILIGQVRPTMSMVVYRRGFLNGISKRIPAFALAARLDEFFSSAAA